MKKLKIVLLGGIALMAIAVVGLAIFVATFDANRYKPQIVALVKEKTGRTLELEGDIQLSLFPKLGASFGRVRLSERGRDQEFAAIESARISVALWPLLRREAVVDEVALTGLRAHLVRFKDGSTNFQDLLAVPAPKSKEAQVPPAAVEEPRPPFAIDIDQLTVSDATLYFRDEAQGRELTLRNLNLKTGRIADDVPSVVGVTFAAAGKRPDVQLDVRFQGRLAFNLKARRVALNDLSLDVTGDAAGLRRLQLTVYGDVTANAKTGEFAIDKLRATLTGQRGSETLDVAVEAPKLVLAGEHFSGEKATVNVRRAGSRDTLVANLSIAGVQGSAREFKAEPLFLELDGRQGEQTFKASASAPLAGNWETREFQLKPLKVSGTALGPGVPGGKASAELAGEVAVSVAKETVGARLQGTLLDSPLSATVDVRGFTQPKIVFALAMKTLDWDRLTGGVVPAAGKKAGTEGAEAKQNPPLDFGFLKNLHLDGVVKLGELKAAKLKATDVRLDVKAAGGRLKVAPSATLYQGRLSGTLSAVGTQPPTISIQQQLAGVQVGPLLKDFSGTDRLEGRGTVTVDLNGQAGSVEALKKALRGTVAFKLNDGALKGVNIAETLREAKATAAALRGKQVQAASGEKKTDFTELSGTFVLKEGIARNDDLRGKSPLLRLTGAGTVDIVNDTLDYVLKATVVATSKGQGAAELAQLKGVTVPVRVTGPLAQPKYEFDFGAIAGDVAKRALEREIQRKLGGAQEGGAPAPSPLDALKGLFQK